MKAVKDNGGGGDLVEPVAAEMKHRKKKKAGRYRLWMRLDRTGQSELIECDRAAIIHRVSIPARDLKILGPIFSHSPSIIAREKAMIVNLEFIRAIITAEEILLLDPLRMEVLPFVDQLRKQFPQNNHHSPSEEGFQDELPFEFRVLEIALEIVCTYFDSTVEELERDTYPSLNELTKSVSMKMLDLVRTLKSNLNRLLGRVQKVIDEIEHLLDDNEDMAQLYLTRKWIQIQQREAVTSGIASSSRIVTVTSNLRRLRTTRRRTFRSNTLSRRDVDDLAMLLEAYVMQLYGTKNKILSVRGYIEDSEDYTSIQLDTRRNELIELQLTLVIASFAIELEGLITGLFGMYIPYNPFKNTEGAFWPFVAGITAACLIVFFLLLGYARWEKLIS